MATAERRTYPDDSRPMRLAARAKNSTPVWREWSAGCNFKARLPIMIMDQQKSPKNLPEETLPHHNRSGRSLLA